MMKKKLFIVVSLMFLFFFLPEVQLYPQELSKEKLNQVMEKYDYNNWAAGSGAVISGVKISRENLPRLSKMKKMWEKDSYHIGNIDGKPYTVIRQWWKSEDGNTQLNITMVVCPTFETTKKFLISRYASSNLGPHLVKSHGYQLGIKVGNVCFVSEAKQKGNLSTVDFIRDNVLFMMRTEGSKQIELESLANGLDGLLRMENPSESYLQLKEIPHILNFSCEKTRIKLGESLPLYLEVNNPGQRKMRYFWKMSGGGVEKDTKGNFLYYGGEVGKHKITVTVVNELGLQQTKSLEIEVVQ